MPRLATPCSSRTMKGTPGLASARSSGRAEGSSSGLNVPSVERYDHRTTVGAEQSSSRAGPSP